MIRGRQLAGASLGLGGVTIWLGMLGLVTTPYLINELGAAYYGVFALITIISAYLMNLEFGFGYATVRFLARARAGEDIRAERDVLGTGLAVFLGGGLLAAAIAFGASSWIVDTFVHGPQALDPEALDAIRIGTFIVFASFLSSFASASLQAFGQFRQLLGTRLVFGTLLSVVAVAVVAGGGGLVAVLIGQAVVSAGLCLTLIAALARAAAVPLRPRIRRETLRAMAGFGAMILTAGLLYQVMLQGPPTILAAETTADQIAAFAVPNLVLQQLVVLATATSFGFFPFVSAASAEPDQTRVGSMFLANLRLTLLAMGPVAAFLAWFAQPLLEAWIGGGFASEASGALRYLSIAALALALSAAPSDGARGLGHPGWTVVFTAAAATIAVGGSLVLADDHGATGVSAALAGALVVATLPFIVIVSRRLLAIRLADLGRALGPPAAAVAGCAALIGLGAEIASTFLGAVVTGVTVAVVYVTAAVVLVLDDRERSVLLRQADGRIPRWRLGRPARQP
jgi:O-antigen/teichoic acid export membrane protein